MLNVLLVEDNLLYAKKMMDYVNKSKFVKVSNIAIDGKEALDILNNRNDIDIFLLDLELPIYNGLEILKSISADKKEKYKNSCIVISGKDEFIQKLIKDDMIYSFIHKNLSMSDILNKIMELIKNRQNKKQEEDILENITNELIYLGYNVSHIGTKYLIDSIYYIVIQANQT